MLKPFISKHDEKNPVCIHHHFIIYRVSAHHEDDLWYKKTGC